MSRKEIDEIVRALHHTQLGKPLSYMAAYGADWKMLLKYQFDQVGMSCRGAVRPSANYVILPGSFDVWDMEGWGAWVPYCDGVFLDQNNVMLPVKERYHGYTDPIHREYFYNYLIPEYDQALNLRQIAFDEVAKKKEISI